MIFKFKVLSRYGAKGPGDIIAQFKLKKDAELFIDRKQQDDQAFNVAVTYLLDDGIEAKEVTKSSTDTARAGAASSSGQGSGQSARPTPLPTAPRPPGSPQRWGVNEDDKDKNK